MVSISLFEQELVHHCSPAFAKLKPANLVCFQKQKFPNFDEDYKEYKTKLKKFGIEIEELCSCEKRHLVLVYQKDALEHQLKRPEILNQLKRYGYPDGDLNTKLQFLSERLSKTNGFPHEIGLFLGYPLRDVLAFEHYKGEGAKLCGYWKVYFDVENAKKTFDIFDKCRDKFEERLFSGKTLAQLLEMQLMLTA